MLFTIRSPTIRYHGATRTRNVEDHPFASVPNVTRIVVEGSDLGRREWLAVSVDPRSPAVFSWEKVPLEVLVTLSLGGTDRSP